MPSAFQIEKQPQNSNWCWAAIGVSVNRYFLPNTNLTQHDLASQILNAPGNHSTPSSGTNKTAHLQRVLRHLNVLNEPPRTGIVLPFDDVRAQIKASLPVCVRIGWPDQLGGHFVVIRGFAVSVSGRQWVDIADPSFDDSIMPYNDFVRFYQGVGQWTDTFLLQPPLGETN